MAAFTGAVAAITWHYFDAAAVHGYSITRVDGTWYVHGLIVLADAFKLTQRPLFFEVRHKSGVWRWPILDPVPRFAGPLAVRLGPPIKPQFIDRKVPAHVIPCP